MNEHAIDCFGKYKMFIGHESCQCDECVAREDCRVERDRRKEELLKKYSSEPD